MSKVIITVVVELDKEDIGELSDALGTLKKTLTDIVELSKKLPADTAG